MGDKPRELYGSEDLVMAGRGKRALVQKLSGVVCFIALVALQAGCLMLPVPQTSDRVVDNAKLDSLIGASKVTMIDEIGEPTYRLTGVEADFLIYRGYIDSTGVIFMLWIPVGVDVLDKDTLDCLKLEFKDGTLRSYEFRTRSMTYHDEIPRKMPDCRRLFWTAEELRTLVPADKAPSITSDDLLAKAEQGDDEAQLQLYHNTTSGSVSLELALPVR